MELYIAIIIFIIFCIISYGFYNFVMSGGGGGLYGGFFRQMKQDTEFKENTNVYNLTERY